MNSFSPFLTATLLMVGTSCAWAASSVDLSVKGLIVPSACTPSLSNDGNVDYGKIAARDLAQDTFTHLPYALLQFKVNCEASTLFALRGIDNRTGSSIEAHSFGLGMINGSQKVGGYYAIFQDAYADGVALYSLWSSDGGSTWKKPNGSDTWWLKSDLIGFGNDASGVLAPVPIRDLTSNLYIRGYIAPASMLTLTQEQPIDGSLTTEMFYL